MMVNKDLTYKTYVGGILGTNLIVKAVEANNKLEIKL